MTTNQPDRLDRIEAIVESNSRAIQAMLDAQTEARLEREEFRSEITQTTASINEAIQQLTTLNEGVVNLLVSLDNDRPTILRRLRSIEDKVDQLLEQRDGGQ
jgi:uncharacterized protein Yka (UPF0111/DUF47 family)